MLLRGARRDGIYEASARRQRAEHRRGLGWVCARLKWSLPVERNKRDRDDCDNRSTNEHVGWLDLNMDKEGQCEREHKKRRHAAEYP